MQPGTLIADRYRIERELGSGGMGAVFVARDERLDARVALKVAATIGHAHAEFAERFRREARIGHLLGQDPGFVRAYDWGELPGRGGVTSLYLAMDLVPDACALDLRTGTLHERLGKVLAGARLVARAHARGVIHRDVKPENLLVDGEGRVWLADFGLAKQLGASSGSNATTPEALVESPPARLTCTGLGMGTPFYMPPEQFENVKDADQRADVYALGVMLFVALVRCFPYDGQGPSEVLAKQMRVRYGAGRAPRPRDHDRQLPRELDELCARALDLDPELRLASVDALIEPLARYLEQDPAAEVDPAAAVSGRRLPTPWRAPPARTPPPPAEPTVTGPRVVGVLRRRSARAAVAAGWALARPFWSQAGVVAGTLCLVSLASLAALHALT